MPNSKLILVLCLFLLSFPSVFAAPDFATIKHQAKLSDDTYLAPNTLQQRLKEQGETLLHQSIIPASQVSYFLSQTPSQQTIAIRGTANLENAMLDLDLELKPDAQLDIKLHQGFASGAKAVYADIKPFLSKQQTVQITGHSLGGAIAVILALYMQQDGYQISQVVTFGQPKVTNVTGAKKFTDLPLTRIVTAQDIVPLVPPISPMQIRDLDIYWHMGEEIILMDNKEFARTNGLKSMLRATKFTTSIPNEKNLIAHQMTTYLNTINALQSSSVEVDYKTDINLFGFSFD
ncbi:lipase family protein [Marinomonas sp. M1K-6]|uniref:Lipase family protein n=1 Tax=Marinomonas profundi TaxID=2726122 RepID=A0A847QXS0_9GAMM|nr:lipase family protein [Marinomonas profundi]NLQ18628.1 lipase family protein [Marinomonas profundi]UDV02878.1 lipase family protein [Marinomonas profundi]